MHLRKICFKKFLFFGKDLNPVEILNPSAYQNHPQSSWFILDNAKKLL